MRGIAILLLVICCVMTGCNKPGNPSASVSPTTTRYEELTRREARPVSSKPAASTSASVSPLPKLPLGGVFKPIPQRSTQELLEEVEHFSTKDHLPLLAELATRTKDKMLIAAKMAFLQTDGRYIVRVAAANVAVAVDSENVGKHAAMLSVAVNRKEQRPIYGPVVEDAPELRKIQKLTVSLLIKLLEKELAEAKLYEQTLGALTVLGTFPKEVGKPAVQVVQTVATTPMHPNGFFATQTLKKWGIE